MPLVGVAALEIHPETDRVPVEHHDEEAGTVQVVPRSDPPSGPSSGRQLVDFLVVLLVGILFTRTFLAEAYIVPTGSMAPTLLGIHQSYTCPNCRHRFALGMDESGYSGHPVCPNCGFENWGDAPGVLGSGDRLLVQKYLFDLIPPRRWESVVFQNPSNPSEAYVKRVVGLPGESVLIRGGDIYIDGRIARKTLEEQRSLRVLVYDNRHLPDDHARYPRWSFRREGPRFARPPSSWGIEGTSLVRAPVPETTWGVDWAEYRHWQADRGDYGPLCDFNPYNGLEVPGENRVDDLMVEADVVLAPEVESLLVRIGTGLDVFHIQVPVDRQGPIQVRRNREPVPVWETGAMLPSSSGESSRPVHVEISLIDRRLLVALDGVLAIEPIDFEVVPSRPYGRGDSPVALGILGSGAARIDGLRIWRDIFYTDALARAPKRPFGIGEPFQLGEDEYFVLGDNSPVSNDSRFWPESPVVRRELLIGKPFLVHLPSQAVPLQVFGHELYWIPDPREIRYIR